MTNIIKFLIALILFFILLFGILFFSSHITNGILMFYPLERNRYNDLITLSNFHEELFSDPSSKDKYARLRISATVETKKEGTYYIAPYLVCVADCSLNYTYTVNGKSYTPGNPAPLMLLKGRSDFHNDFIFEKLDFGEVFQAGEPYKTRILEVSYKISKRETDLLHNVLSIGRKTEEGEYTVGTGYYATRKYQERELITSENNENIPPIRSKKMISSAVCEIALEYPENWNASVVDSNNQCGFEIEHPSISYNKFTLTSIPNTSWDEWVNKYKNTKTVRVAGTEGFYVLQTTNFTDLQFGITYFHKGNTVYSAYYYIQKDHRDVQPIYDAIINSIKFTNNP